MLPLKRFTEKTKPFGSSFRPTSILSPVLKFPPRPHTFDTSGK
jgi:hypothetical protein